MRPAGDGAVWHLILRDSVGAPFGGWDQAATRFAEVLPGLRPTFGLQPAFRHARFDVVVDLGCDPRVPEVALLVALRGEHPRVDPQHPVWAVLEALDEAAGGVIYDVDTKTMVEVPAPAGAALPPNLLDGDRACADSGPLVGLSDIEWSVVRHARGPAIDLPPLIKSLVSTAERIRAEAWPALWESICPGDAPLSEASYAVVPWLLRLIGDPATPDRASILDLLRALGRGRGADNLIHRVGVAVDSGRDVYARLAESDGDAGREALFLLVDRRFDEARELLARAAGPAAAGELEDWAARVAWQPVDNTVELIEAGRERTTWPAGPIIAEWTVGALFAGCGRPRTPIQDRVLAALARCPAVWTGGCLARRLRRAGLPDSPPPHTA